MAREPSTAVIGLGLMGRPMARNLVAAGFDVLGWNRSPLEPRETERISLAGSLEEAAAAEALVLVLADSAAVGEVLERLDPHLRAGQIVVDMGSSRPLDSRARAAALRERGIGWVDAPVSGGAAGAAAATLAIMVGGEAGDVARVEPLLRALGQNVVHVGGPGAGHVAKVANQVIVGLALEGVAEALALVEAAGLDPKLVQRALRGGWADSRILQEQGTRMVDRDYVPGGKVATIRKDLGMARELAAELGLELPHVESAHAAFSELLSRGDGELDCAAVFELRTSRPHARNA